MWRWTIKSLLAQPGGLVVSIAAAGSAFLLVMLFEAVFAGEAEQVVAYVRHADADVWVMQRGVSNMHMATSYLNDWKLAEVGEIPEVAAVEGILYLNTVIESGGQHWYAYIVGLDVPNARAGPWAMSVGKANPGPGETVVPAVFANLSGLALGARLRITDQEFTVVGFSEGTFSMANSIIFVTKTDLEDIMSSLDIVSYGLVKAEPGVAPEALAATIEREIDKVHALPAAQFIRNDRRMALQMGVETIAMMTVISGGLAVLLIAFTVYSQVGRQRQELAVAKALGVPNSALYSSVSAQAAIISIASVIVSTTLAMVVIPLAGMLIPTVTLKLTVSAVLRVAVIGISVAIVASLIPAREIAAVDPLSALRT